VFNKRAGKAAEGIMRKIVSVLVILSVVFGVFSVGSADARGGRGDDCQQGSTDPDCK
jgi:hypothetical protein